MLSVFRKYKVFLESRYSTHWVKNMILFWPTYAFPVLTSKIKNTFWQYYLNKISWKILQWKTIEITCTIVPESENWTSCCADIFDDRKRIQTSSSRSEWAKPQASPRRHDPTSRCSCQQISSFFDLESRIFVDFEWVNWRLVRDSSWTSWKENKPLKIRIKNRKYLEIVRYLFLEKLTLVKLDELKLCP